ncbi:MAG: hypothetical protein KJO22_02200 [Bacteroidia bacterium]|nr:hypothetical protein [Bacteroidia bacterium]
MNVICIGYFDKFSRYFLDIKKHLKTNFSSNLHFRIYSIYFSGFLYAFIRLNHSSWLPVKAWLLVLQNKTSYKAKIASSNTYKGIEYETFIKFHTSLSNLISPQRLKLQALAYIDIFETVFSSNKPDVLVCVGDSRMPFEIAIAIAKQKQIPVYYLEQGPFNTTFFDHKGVNANLSVKDGFTCNMDFNSEDLIIENKTLKTYHRSPIYRGLDILLKALFEKTRVYPPDIKHTDLNSYKKPKRRSPQVDSKSIEKSILIILQVPLDVNMIYHSPYFTNHYDMVKAISSNLPEDYQLIVREHPLYINIYESKLYDLTKKQGITIDNSTDLKQAITSSSLVIVNNSTVGLEAIFYHKPVLVLGDAFYDNNDIAYKYHDGLDMGELIKKAIETPLDVACIERYKRFLYKTVLLQGSMSEKLLRSSKTVANRLSELMAKSNTR